MPWSTAVSGLQSRSLQLFMISESKQLMVDDRRSHTALSLRSFFDEQLQHLQALADSLLNFPHTLEEPVDAERQIIESFVDEANARIRAVAGYADKLRLHVCKLHQHVVDVAAELPPPVDLNHQAFMTNPLVNSLFVSTDDIDDLMRGNPELNSFLSVNGEQQAAIIFALLTAYRTEKNILGVGMMGDMLVREVPQRVVNFEAHKLHIPCVDQQQLSTLLTKYLFERIVELLKQKMALRLADEYSSKADKSYQSRLNSLANPEVYLHTLIGHLENPVNLLRIDKEHLKLSKLGIKLNMQDRDVANEFEIHELTWSNGIRNVVVQVAYSH